SPGKYVKLTVSDTGHGIAIGDSNRIFDPYYTTKEVGKGTGMGLSVVHGIVKGHGGSIKVQSEPGVGTTFEIFLPAIQKEAAPEIGIVADLPTGTERILFVDDEASLVSLNHQRLERLGYEVKSTQDPLEAMKLFRSDPDLFDLVITDMTMPRMTGDELAQEILKVRPNLPVILCTGYSEKISESSAKEIGIRKYIEKPVDIQKLAITVREVLDGK
ncbi:MAG: response regulator, partial [Deltaproteobacteria bacterium]|nr:response regulator [Deltaproteobacteria bacterium]